MWQLKPTCWLPVWNGEVTMRGQSAALEPGSVLLKASDGYVGIFTW